MSDPKKYLSHEGLELYDTEIKKYVNEAISNQPSPLPSVTAGDSGKFLRVSSTGNWTAEMIPNAEEATF